jgi:hypothetical protein
MEHSIEITKEAAWKLIGNDEKTWTGYKQGEHSETSFYIAHGVKIATVYSYLSDVTQYFIQDINA